MGPSEVSVGSWGLLSASITETEDLQRPSQRVDGGWEIWPGEAGGLRR